MPRNSKRKAAAPVKFVPPVERIDLIDDSSETPPTSDSDLEVCEIVISSDSGIFILFVQAHT